jgi:hypothetical protein
VDQLLNRGVISPRIPEIRKKAVEVLRASYETTELAFNGIAGLSNYYRAYYPDFYDLNQELIEAAIAALQEAYTQSVFPEQKANWDTHPDNVGHMKSPGCFRCHDGKHLNSNGEAIRLECNLCHSIPVVAGPNDFVTHIEISRGPEPESHLHANWIALHRDTFDTTCSNCHTTEDPGGTSNTSFCSNSACHGQEYEYAGFDAPGLREILAQQLPPTPTPAPAISGALVYDPTINALFSLRCGDCHGENGIQGLNLLTYETTMAGGAHGAVIIPGDPESSPLIQKQITEIPHFGQFTEKELQMIVDWIAIGAPEK